MSTGDIPTMSKLSQRFDVNLVRQDFPILNKTAYDKPLHYFDNRKRHFPTN